MSMLLHTICLSGYHWFENNDLVQYLAQRDERSLLHAYLAIYALDLLSYHWMNIGSTEDYVTSLAASQVAYASSCRFKTVL